ncbi:MAG: hypothetical protein HKP59_02940 [Lutibacter sp.]|uniref:hypothetical protein n=1 Tax=Lutibacter sp. TaxID=1925666 RepID=UPI00179AF102|nr:hypothetical protein [Lutibacter sp.]MBT8316561.1 hypothetical protein [Lutibacter sp.]NNJ57421.1 hypothetical protein [Lutibacter sp.]
MSSNRFASHQFLFGCAFLNENKNCPFTELRKLAIEERVEYLKKMTFQQIFNLEYTHKHCQNKAFQLKKNIFKKRNLA